MINLTDEVRNFSNNVFSNTRVFSIDRNKLRDLELLVFKLRDLGITEPFASNKLELNKKLGLTIFFNVVNFCFMDPESKSEYKYNNGEGDIVLRSTGLFRAMQDAGVDWGNFKHVVNLKLDDWKKITQINKNNPLYLGIQRHSRIIKFAGYLISKGYENPMDFVQDNNHDVDFILNSLVESSLFDDEFLKRAQVVTRGINDVVKLQGVEHLTCMADYRIPQVFYNLGVLRLDENVLKKLIDRENIETGNEIEISLRSSVIVIGEMLSKMLNEPESRIDVLLWRLSQDLAKNNMLAIPHMIVATDKY